MDSHAPLTLCFNVERNFSRYVSWGILFFAFAFPILATSQTSVITSDVSRPVVGAGHDYIKSFSETVNPANGSISLNLNLPAPKSRGFSLPIGLTYNSGQVNHFFSGFPGIGSLVPDSSTSLSSGGWGDTLPYATSSDWTVALPSSLVNGNWDCEYTSSYVFYDPSGGSHMLGLAGVSYLQAQGGGGNPDQNTCPTPASGTQYYGIDLGGDSRVSAATAADCDGYARTPAAPASCSFGQFSFTVTELDGTVYDFPWDQNVGYVQYTTNSSGSAVSTSSRTDFLFPTTIEDRNGNIMAVSTTVSNSALPPSSETITDTTGRTLAAVTNPGEGTGPTQYVVAGQTYTLAYSETTASFTLPSEAVGTALNLPSNETCNPVLTVPNSTSGTGISLTPNTGISETVSSITLPNQQQFLFYYGENNPNDASIKNPYGLLNEIIYPDGGWVKYTWKLNDTYSDALAFNGVTLINGQPQGDTGNSCTYIYKTPVVATRQVGFSAGSPVAQTQKFTYSTVWNSSSDQWLSKTTTVTTTDNLTGRTAQTIYTYGSVGQPNDIDSQGSPNMAQIPVESSVAYYDWASTATPIKTVYKTWADQFEMGSDETIWSNGLGTLAVYCYAAADLVAEEDDYNFLPSSTPISQLKGGVPACDPSKAPKSTTYAYYSLAQPNQIVTYAAGTRIAETDAYYDGFQVLNPTSNGPNPAPASPVAVGVTISASIHDEVNFGASSTKIRANPTQVVHWSNSGSSPTTTFTYDQTGQVRSRIDGCGNASCADMTGAKHTTTYSYADNFTTLSGTVNDSYTPKLSTNAYLTLIIDPLGHTAGFTYDYFNGQLTTSVDANQQSTYYVYNDPLNRLKLTQAPDGGQTKIAYIDPAQAISGMVPTVTTSELISSGGASKMTVTFMDGMEHATGTEVSDPEGAVYTTTTYNGMGEISSTTNPYRSTSDPTYGKTAYFYDALGRKIQVQNQDGTTDSWCYSGATNSVVNPCPSSLAGGYSTAFPPVTWVDSYDEIGNLHQTVNDGFGRLIAVLEPNGTSPQPTMETDYGYDLLNNLWGVVQWGGASGSNGSRVRSFTYDSLSRLLCASNSEESYAACPTSASTSQTAGTTGYSYDYNGNLSSKTDARGIKTSYTYDAVNRLLAKSFSDGTNASCYRYDAAALSGTTQFQEGRLTGEWTQAGACPATSLTSIPSTAITAQAFMQYDAVGRLQNELYCTPQNCTYTNGVSAVYDLAGDTTSLTYPDGRVITQGFDSVTRLTSTNYFSWGTTGINIPYLTAISYDAADHPTSWTMGSGTGATTATSAYNPRLELTSLGYAQGSNPALWGKSYGWTANGNLQQTTDSVSGVIRQFGYDTLNRLTSAQDLKGTSSGSGQSTNSSDQTQTNVLEDSQAIGSSGWSISQASLVSNAVAAPDGTMTASSLTASSTSTDSFALDEVLNPALYDDLSVGGSVWLRTPTGTLTATVSIVHGPPNGFSSLQTQSVTLTPTWQQVNLSAVTPNGLNGLGLQIGGSSFTSGEIDIWGAQLGPASTGSSVTNILPFSQQWNGITWASANVTAVASSVAAPDGSTTGFQATANSGSTDSYVADYVQNPAQYSNATLTGSVYLRVPSGTQTLNLYIVNWGSAGYSIPVSKSITLTTAWQRFQLTGTAPAGLTTLLLQIGGAGSVTSGQTFDVWGAQLEVASTAGQYVATLDSPVSVTADSTNILPSSSQVSGQGWYVYNGTTTANTTAVTAPDGSNTADEFTATSGSTAGYMYDSVANPGLYDGATVTGSIYLQAANSPQTLTINIKGVNAAGTTVIGTLNAAVTTTWQRFDLPSGVAPNGMTLLYLSLGSSSNSQFASTNPIYIWGAQMEMGSSAGNVNETSNTTSGTGGSTLAADGLNESYSYDAFGNMLSAGNFNFQQAYTTANQLSGWVYDAAGNLLNNGLGDVFTYDAEERISTMGGNTYVYDAEGSRVAKTGSSAIDYISFGGRQIARLAGGQWTDLIYGVNGLLAEVPGTQTGTPVYRMLDHLGSVAGTLNSSGTLLSSMDYAPFGQIFAGGTTDPYIFTGKERDSESGNDYFGARYYASSMGRWMSPDWNSGPSPVPYAHFDDPQSLNLYSYVLNNPLSHSDPDGHECTVDGEKHGGLWCFAHYLGITETKKEKAAAEAYADAFWKENGANVFNASMLTSGIYGSGLAIQAGQAGAAANAAAATASESSAGGWVTVGRWMSQEELAAMRNSGVAQESTELGGSRVAQPSDPNAYKNAPPGSVYVEYQVPAGSTKPAGSGWAKIPGPNSTEGRLAASKGQPAPQMPPVRNIIVKGQK